MKNKKFEIIEHTADVGIKVYGDDLKELFTNSFLGMYSLICDITKVDNKKSCEFSINSFDIESLLVKFLNELIYYTFTKLILFSQVKIIKLDEKNFVLDTICFGEEYLKEKHGHLLELKSTTFHNLKIEKTQSGYFTTVIFDT